MGTKLETQNGIGLCGITVALELTPQTKSPFPLDEGRRSVRWTVHGKENVHKN